MVIAVWNHAWKLLLSSYSQVGIVMAYWSTCWRTLGFPHLVETWALNPMFLGLIFDLFLFMESDGLQVGMCDFLLPWQPDMKLPKHISLLLQTTHHQKPPLPSAEAMRISWATTHPLGWKMPLFLKDWNSSLSSSLPTSLGKTHIPGPKIVSRNISTLQSNRALMRMSNYPTKNIWCHEDSWIVAGNMTWMWIMNPTSIIQCHNITWIFWVLESGITMTLSSTCGWISRHSESMWEIGYPCKMTYFPKGKCQWRANQEISTTWVDDWKTVCK